MSTVHQLHKATDERIEHVRQWHAEQAAGGINQVAAMHLAITDDCQIRTAFVAVEPEHAAALLGQLDQVPHARPANHARGTRAACPPPTLPLSERSPKRLLRPGSRTRVLAWLNGAVCTSSAVLVRARPLLPIAHRRV